MPLIAVCPSVMSAAAQENVARFAASGGMTLVTPAIPDMDYDFNPVSVISDALGGLTMSKAPKKSVRTIVNGKRLYQLGNEYRLDGLAESAVKLAYDEKFGHATGAVIRVGGGEVRVLLGTWILRTFSQIEMLEDQLEAVGARPRVESSNRNVWLAVLKEDGGQRRILFIMNLYSSPQSTRDKAYVDGLAVDVGTVSLAAMEVKAISI
ncbi:MAG: hypothetical protein LBS11_02385 [Oscillospiraceae bacterium]|jgi:hypothetical protein|nr:hypothetical protein [Oscillospiraceae bacterium]